MPTEITTYAIEFGTITPRERMLRTQTARHHVLCTCAACAERTELAGVRTLPMLAADRARELMRRGEEALATYKRTGSFFDRRW